MKPLARNGPLPTTKKQTSIRYPKSSKVERAAQLLLGPERNGQKLQQHSSIAMKTGLLNESVRERPTMQHDTTIHCVVNRKYL
jgi:hypothetical protein